jgi:hypothetical protein
VTSGIAQSLRSMSHGQVLVTKKKCLFKMHLYLKYQNLNTFGSKDVVQPVQVKVFKTRSKFKIKVTRSKVLVPKKVLFIMHLYPKYQSLYTSGSKDTVFAKTH